MCKICNYFLSMHDFEELLFSRDHIILLSIKEGTQERERPMGMIFCTYITDVHSCNSSLD